MSAYPLRDLLRVRDLREGNARKEREKKKYALECICRSLEDKQSERMAFQRYRLQRETDLFTEIKGELVHPKDLEELKTAILLLREREQLILEEEIKLKGEQESAEQQVVLAQEELKRMSLEKKKIEEHQRIWLEEAAKGEERALEKESEDFRVLKADNLFFEDCDDENI